MNRFLLLLLSISFSVVLSAQVIPSVGMHGYLNERIQDVSSGPDDIELDGRSGWHAGLDFRLGKKVLYLQPGIHYYSTSSEVTDLSDPELPQDFSDKQRHQALKIPLQAGLRLGLNKTAALHLQGGPVATAAIRERLVTDQGGQRNLALGMQAGVAVDLLRFNIHARYEWGLTPAFKYTDATSDVLSVGLGLVF